MRTLLAASLALVAILGVVSGKLWLELRDARRELAETRSPAVQPATPTGGTQLLPQSGPAADITPSGVIQPEDTQAVSRAPEAASPPPPVVLIPTPLSRPQPVITEAIRSNASVQAEQTATARVLAWKDRLAMAGHTLTTEQLQALNAAATAELKREAQESLELAAGPQPNDIESSFRQREETLNRNNDTNMRILAAVSPKLSAEATKALRTQFESGHAARLSALRAELDAIRQLQ